MNGSNKTHGTNQSNLLIQRNNLLPPEVGGNLSPRLRIPLDEGHVYGVGAQPVLCPSDDLIELCRFFVVLQFGLTLSFSYPSDGSEAVAVDGFPDVPLFHERQCVDDSKEFADIVCSVNRSEMKHLCSCRQVDALIFHRSGVARTGSIYRPRVGFDGRVERQYGVVPPVRWI